MRSLLLALALVFSHGAAAQDQAAVLASIHTFFDGFAARDSTRMLAVSDPAGRLVLTGSDADGQPSVRTFPMDAFIRMIATREGPPIVETIRNPRVAIRDNLATVWVDYDVWVGEEIDHCGEDAFQLARSARGWIIVAVADTQRRDCTTPATGPGPDDLKALYEAGTPFGRFVDQARRRKVRWESNRDAAAVPDDLLARAQAIPGTWHLVVVAEDWCSDSSDTIPHLAALAESMPNVDLRIVSAGLGDEVMVAYRTPDGRKSTPTVLITNDAFETVGCFIERPRALQEWALENRASLSDADFVRRKTAWYDWDQGRSTIADFVGLLERASTGVKGCE